MSLPEIHLRAAAGAIDQMSRTDLERALAQLKERRRARTQMEVLQETEMASIDLEQAAYRLASEEEAKGNLSSAARWYTAAAINDFADASLKLARILDALAEKHLHAREGNPATREELDLVSEACRWYSDALAAGETEAEELLDNLIDRHLGRSRTNATAAGAVKPGPQSGSGPQEVRAPSGPKPVSPDPVPGVEARCSRSINDHPAVDQAQPDLAGLPKNLRK